MFYRFVPRILQLKIIKPKTKNSELQKFRCMKIKMILFLLILLEVQKNETYAQKNTEKNSFPFELYNTLSKEEKGNFVFSPYGISQSLAMVYEGAESKTAEQMQMVLGYPKDKKSVGIFFYKANQYLNSLNDSLNIKITNQMCWQKDYSFLVEYLANINKNYKAKLFFVNFKSNFGRKQAVCKINRDIKKATNGNIKKLIEYNQILPVTKLIVTNAIWFKGDWESSFSKENTSKQLFKNLDKTETEISMMYQKRTFDFYESKKLKAIKLPYKGRKVSLFVIMPRQIDDFFVTEQKFNETMMGKIEKKMKNSEVELTLPKFSTVADFSLEEAFLKLGMERPFSDKANFSGISKENDLKIDKIIHKAIIEVSEEGTEAAAATAVIMVRKAAISSATFFANKPFIYFIKDEQNHILFMGKYVSAKKQ